MSSPQSLLRARPALAGALLVPALLLALVGCSGTGPSPTTAAGDSASMDVPANTVMTIGLKFMPNDITVPVGTTVTWTNGESISHTVTSGAWGEVNEATGLRGSQNADGMFDHKLAPKGTEGDTFSYTFTEAGEFPYFCQPHLTMNATVTVEP